MYAKNIRSSAKREIQAERNAKRDDRIARPRCAQNVLAKRVNFLQLTLPNVLINKRRKLKKNS